MDFYSIEISKFSAGPHRGQLDLHGTPQLRKGHLTDIRIQQPALAVQWTGPGGIL